MGVLSKTVVFIITLVSRNAICPKETNLGAIMHLCSWFAVFAAHGSHGNNPLLTEFTDVHTVD